MFRRLLTRTVSPWAEVAAIVLFAVLACLTAVAYGDAGSRYVVRRLAAQLLDAGDLYTMDVAAQPPTITPSDPAWTNAELTAAVRNLARHAGVTEMFLYVDLAEGTTLVNPTPGDRTALDQRIAQYRGYLGAYERRQAAGAP